MDRLDIRHFNIDNIRYSALQQRSIVIAIYNLMTSSDSYLMYWQESVCIITLMIPFLVFKILSSEINWQSTSQDSKGVESTPVWWSGDRGFCEYCTLTGGTELVSGLTFRHRNYFLLILAHPLYKLWIIQEQNTLEIWNKLHFEEEKNVDGEIFRTRPDRPWGPSILWVPGLIPGVNL